MISPRVTKALNPHRRKRKLSLKQIRAGFGGKRRRASLKASKKHTHKRRARNPKAANPKPKRRATARARTRVIYKTRYKTRKVYVHSKPKRKANPKRRRSSNPGPYLLTMAPVGNPHRKRRKTSMAKAKRKVSAKGRSGKRNPTRRRSVAKRNTHRKRNPLGGGNPTSLIQKAAGVFIGFSASKKLPPMFGAQMNSSPMMTLLSTAVTAGLTAWIAKKFAPAPFAEGVMWGGLGGTFNMAWNTWAPAQLQGYWPGVGDFVPGGFPLPQGPVRYALSSAPMEAPNGSQVNVGAFGRAW